MLYKIKTEQIKQKMLSKGYSINKLSKESKVSKSSISKLLNNLTQPHPQTLYKIAVALDLDINEIITYEEDK